MVFDKNDQKWPFDYNLFIINISSHRQFIQVAVYKRVKRIQNKFFVISKTDGQCIGYSVNFESSSFKPAQMCPWKVIFER